MEKRIARLGLILFAVYLILYGLFVLLAAFAPDVMERLPAGGINLAVWYGLGLIVAAFVLALIYGFLCRPNAEEAAAAKSEEQR